MATTVGHGPAPAGGLLAATRHPDPSNFGRGDDDVPLVRSDPRASADAAALEDVAILGAVLARLADRIGAGGARDWPSQVRRRVLAGLDRSVDTLGVVRAAVLVAEKESGAWQGSGDRSFEAWRGRTSRAGQRVASVQVRDAEQLGVVPGVAAAVTDGRIGLEHAVVIARVAAAGSPVQQAAARSVAGQRELMELAARVDAGTFATAATRWAAGVDPVGLERDHQRQRAGRFLHVVDTVRGTVVKGLVDSMAGHRLTLALEAVTAKPGPDDDREPEQRRADALDTIASAVLGSADTKPGAHVPAQVTLILTEATWLAAQAERDRQRRAQLAGSAVPGVDADDPSVAQVAAGGYLPATLEDGTPVPVSELAVALCECDLTRVVIDADGEPLDLGRTERVFTGVHRRAVIARDRECGWPDCHGHARWCQVHHLLWWERDVGATSVQNGMLLCNFHHHEVHRRDLRITRYPLTGSGGAAGAGRPAATMARVGYRFTDQAGRAIGSIPAAPVGGAPPRPPTDSCSGVAPARPPTPGAADDLDWTPTLNPYTGMTQPAFMLG